MEQKVHEGRNVKRIREILGIKQDALAVDLGLSQQAVSQLEQRESIEPELLERVAKKLGVKEEAIKNFNEDAAINIVANTFNSHDNAAGINYKPTINFNPIEKMVELYDALLKEKDERIAMLERLMEKK